VQPVRLRHKRCRRIALASESIRAPGKRVVLLCGSGKPGGEGVVHGPYYPEKRKYSNGGVSLRSYLVGIRVTVPPLAVASRQIASHPAVFAALIASFLLVNGKKLAGT
jgi:hypothetical protein